MLIVKFSITLKTTVPNKFYIQAAISWLKNKIVNKCRLYDLPAALSRGGSIANQRVRHEQYGGHARQQNERNVMPKVAVEGADEFNNVGQFRPAVVHGRVQLRWGHSRQRPADATEGAT